MDVERLKRKRCKNVQEQNEILAHLIRQVAVFWRTHSLPVALRELGVEKGIVWENSVILELELDGPGMPSVCGKLLSQSERFIEFELDTDDNHTKVVEVYEWADVTANQNLSMHNRGVGAAYGALAVNVLHELNG